MAVLTEEWRAHFREFDDEKLAEYKAESEQSYKDAEYYERWETVQRVRKKVTERLSMIVAEQDARRVERDAK